MKTHELKLAEGAEGKKFIVTYKDVTGVFTVLVPADDEYDARDKINYVIGRGTEIVGLPKLARGNEKTDQVFKMYVDPRGGASRPMIVDREQGVAEDINEGSLDEIHSIVSRMMDKYISKYRSGLIDPDHLMSIISKAAQVISNKYNIQQIEAQRLISDYVEDAAVKKDEIANQNYRADTMSESEIREEQLLATDLKRQLELFKRGKDKELGKKPKDAEIQKKRQEK